MKHIQLVALLALIIGCSPEEHLEVKAIDILPPGGDVSSVTAYVDIQGAGIARLDWERRAFGIDSLVQTEYWYIDSSDVYTSTLSVTDGWYWLSIYDEDSVLLATSDVIFCGTGSQLPPIAKFYGEPTSGKVPLDVAFHDQSLNDPTSWLWDLKETGKFDTIQEPWEHYDSKDTGTYDVTLIVSNIAGTDTLTKEDYIHVMPPNPPVADFYADTTEGEAPLRVYFYNQSTSDCPYGGGITYTLGFGDGNSDQRNGSWEHWGYTYRSAGVYTVSLTIQEHWGNDYRGSDTLIREDYITVTKNPDMPVADFYAEPTEGAVPLSVHFHNQSTTQDPSSIRCTWDYGDETQDTITGLYGPYHRYQKEGVFTVTLTIFDTHGADQMTKEDYIHVNP